ncbi:MAG: DUF1592 domain-containing protein [Myxococcota bacterium]
MNVRCSPALPWLWVAALGASACTGQIADPLVPAEAPPNVPSTLEGCVEVPEAAGTALLPRLTRDEVLRSVRDLLEIDPAQLAEAAAALPAETRAPATTSSRGQTTSFAHVTAFSDLAEAAAEAADLAPFVSCASLDESCARPFVESLGERLFRRPLRAPETIGFLPIFEVVRGEGEGFDVAARLVLRAMLQSPQFLYHLEDRRSGPRVDAGALASRIAYLVWGSAPDAALREAARAGALEGAAGIEAEVRRLAEDPRAVEASLTFVEDWVSLERLEQAARDVPDAAKVAMRAETEAFVRAVLWGDEEVAPGGLVDLLTADWTYLGPELVATYDLDVDLRPGELRRVDLSAVPERRGLLTQPAVLAAHANGNRPSIVSRGLFVLRALTCRDLPDPPVGVDTTTTMLPETASERARSEERLDPGTGECGLCHRAFDPLAYAFEPFDGTGRYRSQDVHGNPTREDGWIPAVTGEVLAPYEGIDGLARGLAELPAVHACLAEKPLVFALRRAFGEGAVDRCLVREVEDAARQAGGTYVDLLVAIATHPSFARLAPEGEGS